MRKLGGFRPTTSGPQWLNLDEQDLQLNPLLRRGFLTPRDGKRASQNLQILAWRTIVQNYYKYDFNPNISALRTRNRSCR